MAQSCFVHSSIVSCCIVICSIAFASCAHKEPFQTLHYISPRFAPEVKIANIARAIIEKMASLIPASAFAGPCNLLGKSPEELRAFLGSLGEPAYRGAQIYHALYAERRFAFAGMTNLPAKLRERLSRGAVIELPRIVWKYCSADGTIRYVLAHDTVARDSAAKDSAAKGSEKSARLLTPATIETVFMPEENRQTICISTQAGCAVDCHFCLTATLGLIRNLTAGEIIGQVLIALEENREALKPQTNVVLMGQGEPLLNFDPVMAALRILLYPTAMEISA